MATQTLTRPQPDQTVEKRVQQVQQLYADAPQYVKTALETALPAVMSLVADASQTSGA